MSCFCGSKSKKNKNYLKHINELFEEGNLKLSVLIESNGAIKESYYREDLSPDDVEALLSKVMDAKSTWATLTDLAPKQQLHIQGTHFAISVYPSPVGLFVLMFDLNPSLSGIVSIEKLEPRVQHVLDSITRRK